jgi:hypothetical protein
MEHRNMLAILEILALLTTSIAMALALAHALEFPGKLRLSREDYERVQEIYYPGFTYGGASEVIGLLLLPALLPFSPDKGAPFWLALASFLMLLLMHGVYWLFIHPINSFWLKDFKLTGFGARFFGSKAHTDRGQLPDWTALRDRWEHAHIARAALGLLALASLGAALTLK